MLNNFAFNPIKKIFQYFLTPIKRWFLNDIIYKLNIIESRIVTIQDTVTEKTLSLENPSTTFDIDRRLYTACDIPNLIPLLEQGITFQHPVGVVIASKAKIGTNCKIWQNVIIGAKSNEGSALGLYPEIGNNVQIFAGAVIVGDVKIGDNAIIGANAVVLHDVKPNNIVAGVPAQKIGTTLSKEIAEHTKYEETVAFAKKLDIFRSSDIVSSLSINSVCIDCGANLGEMTAIFAETGSKVYSFEPHPICFAKLTERFAGYDNVTLINKGVMDKNGTMKLYHSDLSMFDPGFFSQNSSFYLSKQNVTSELFDEVNAIDLIDFILSIDSYIDILKLDVEGAEFCILERLIHEDIYKDINYILVETHDDRIPEVVECAKRVRAEIKKRGITNIDLTWC